MSSETHGSENWTRFNAVRETVNIPSPPQPTKRNWRKILVLFLFLAVAFTGYSLVGDDALARFAKHEDALRNYHTAHPTTVVVAAFVLYAVVTGFSIPGALLLSISYAWYFRFWTALPLVSFASTTGATIAFLISRYLFREAVQSRFADRLSTVSRSFDREGPFYLFTLRLIPAIPFFLINILMGLTRIKTSTYWWVSQLGMLPGTIVFLLAGDSLAASVPTLSALAGRDFTGVLTLRIWAAFLLLAGFPYVARLLVRRFAPRAVGG